MEISSFLENDTSRDLSRRLQHIADDRIMTGEIEISSITDVIDYRDGEC